MPSTVTPLYVMIDGVAHLTPSEAGKYLQVSRQRVHQLIRSGRLPSIRLGRGHYVPAREVEALRS